MEPLGEFREREQKTAGDELFRTRTMNARFLHLERRTTTPAICASGHPIFMFAASADGRQSARAVSRTLGSSLQPRWRRRRARCFNDAPNDELA